MTPEELDKFVAAVYRNAGINPDQDHRRCPDDGRCTHECTYGCFRVAYCGPLSAHGDDWSDEELAAYGENDGKW